MFDEEFLKWFLTSKLLKSNEKLILISISMDKNMKVTGKYEKKYKTLSRELSIDVRTINRALKSLENKGLITRRTWLQKSNFTHPTSRSYIFFTKKFKATISKIPKVSLDKKIKSFSNEK